MSQQEQKGKSGARIHAQLAAILAEAEAVGKERRNSGQGFNYRAIEDVMDALHPIFAKHRVFVLSKVIEQKTEERATMKGGNLIYRVLTVEVSYVSGEDGSRETVTVVGEGMDSGDKAANKAMSAALKYALTQTLILPFGQADGDADTPPDSRPKTTQQAVAESPELRKAAAEGRLRDANTGQPIKPQEEPAAKPPETQKQEDRTAFHSRLYMAMAKADIEREELNADLRRKGIMTAAQTIDNLPEKIVTVLLDGKDKASGSNNWDIVVERIKKSRTA